MATLRSSTGPDCVQVPSTVNGKAVPLVVDSGANRTLVRADVLGDSTGDTLPKIPNGLAMSMVVVLLFMAQPKSLCALMENV